MHLGTTRRYGICTRSAFALASPNLIRARNIPQFQQFFSIRAFLCAAEKSARYELDFGSDPRDAAGASKVRVHCGIGIVRRLEDWRLALPASSEPHGTAKTFVCWKYLHAQRD